MRIKPEDTGTVTSGFIFMELLAAGWHYRVTASRCVPLLEAASRWFFCKYFAVFFYKLPEKFVP